MKLHRILIWVSLIFATINATIGIGVKGGLSLYKSEDNRSLSLYNEYLIASNVSLFSEFDINRIFSNSVILSYYRAGGQSTYQETSADFVPTVGEVVDAEKLDYLGIGYSLTLKVPLVKIIPVISAGVSLDFLINTKEEHRIGKEVQEWQTWRDSDYKKVNVRPFISMGVEYKIYRVAIIAEYVFSYNLLPYFEHEEYQSNRIIECRTYGHFVNLGCKVYL